MNFTATTRKAQGTGASRRLRRENKLPGIVYGNDQAATPIVLDHNPIFYALRKEAFHSSVLTLNLDGVDQLVVLRSFQLHPYKQQVLHIDFQRYRQICRMTHFLSQKRFYIFLFVRCCLDQKFIVHLQDQP